MIMNQTGVVGMIELNRDYSGLIEQLEYIKNHILDCKTPNESAVYKSTYNSLLLAYFECTGKKYSDRKINQNQYVSREGSKREKELLRKFHENYLQNKEFHRDFFVSATYDILDLTDEYLESDEYLKLYESYHPWLKEKRNDDLDILNQFLKERDIVLKEIFEDMQKQKQIYYYPSNGLNSGRPAAILNPVENKTSIFIPYSKNNISFLSGIIHELGHVRDFYNIKTRVSKKAQQMYGLKSIYIEVLSTAYQLDFLEFLINNDIKKQEAQMNLVSCYNEYLSFLDDACCYTCLPDQYHMDAVKQVLSEKDIVRIINPSYDQYESLSDRKLNNFGECMYYSYGLLIANTISANKEICDQFLNIRHDSFDEKTLTATGITQEVAREYTLIKMNQNLKK